MSSTKHNTSIIAQVNDVNKSFTVGAQDIEILKGISFKISKGDFLVIFGPSGCGKSTLLNTILGLEPPTKGTVNFLGQDLYKYDEDERAEIRKKDIGMVYQQANWIKALNVVENISFPLTLAGVPASESEKKAIELLKSVKIESAAYQVPTELSSGQQQRVSLCRALISDPAMIIADEPTGNLDSKASNEIMELFREFNKKGKTVIMVTHDLEYLSYATRAINILDGKVVGEYKADDKKLKALSVSKKHSNLITKQIEKFEKPDKSDKSDEPDESDELNKPDKPEKSKEIKKT